MLYKKMIRDSYYVYWKNEENLHPISVGDEREFFDIINLVKKSKFKNKSFVISTLLIVNRVGISKFLENTTKYINAELKDYENRYLS